MTVPLPASARYPLRILTGPGSVAAAALVGLFARIAVGQMTSLPRPGLYEDVAIAINLANGDGFSLDPGLGPTALKAPLYPFLLSLVAVAAPEQMQFLRLTALLNALLAVATILVVGRFAGSLLGRRAGAIAAWIVALFPPHVYLARIPEATNLSLPLAALAAVALVQALRGDRALGAPLAGVAAGIAVLANPIALLALGGFLLAWSISRPRRGLPALLALLLVQAPWAIRNQHAFGRPILVKSAVWLNVYLGLLPENAGGHRLLPDEVRERVEALLPTLSEMEREDLFRRYALGWLGDHPVLGARMAVWRAGQFWGLHGHRPPPRPGLDLVLRRAPMVLLLGAALLGLPRVWRVQRPAAMLLGSFLGSYTLTYALTCAANARYSVDLLWVEATLAAALAWDQTSERR